MLRGAARKIPPLSRLSALARKHRTAVVLLTEKAKHIPSLDPRVIQRFDAARRNNVLVLTVLKDKGGWGRKAPGWGAGLPPGSRIERTCDAPAGMC